MPASFPLAPHLRGALALALALPSSGCCSLARWWCGPDRSHWVSVAYDTPEQALDTFREAVKRDRPKEIYESLSDSFKKEHRLQGSLEAAVAWERLKERFSGLHLLGDAEVIDREQVTPDRVRCTLAVMGHRFHLDLVLQGVDLVRFRMPDGRIEELGRNRDPAFGLRRGEGESIAVLAIDGLDLPAGVSERDLLEVRGAFLWKVGDLQQLPPAPPRHDPVDG